MSSRKRRMPARAHGPASRAGGPAAVAERPPAPTRGNRAAVAADDLSAPSRRAARWLLGGTVALTFLLAFALYLATLAPTVTFEDSGELISAAYTLGVPHEPGYPLWTVIAHLFTLLPFGTVALRVNLMSAVFTAVAAGLIAWATMLLIDECRAGRAAGGGRRVAGSPWAPALSGVSGLLVCAAGLAAGLLAAIAATTWAQAIITEVYGLNAALVALLLLLILVWTRAATPHGRRRLFYAICFVLGLGLTAHDTFVVLLPAVALYGFAYERRLRPSWRQLAAGAGLFVVGLLPYVYLPLAATRRPLMNWGNAGTWTNFWRVVTRHQYVTSGHSGVGTTIAEFGTSASLLVHQWFPALLALALVGLVVLFMRRRPLFWLSATLLVATWPVITLIADFPSNSGDALANADEKALASVFYIPLYLVLGLLMGLGAWWLASAALAWLAAREGRGAARVAGNGGATREARNGGASRAAGGGGRRATAAVAVVAAVVVAVPLVLAAGRAPDITMHRYRFADAYIANVLGGASARSLVMVDRDQFGFPLAYAQDVEHKRPDVIVLDQELLRRSWYLQDLAQRYPRLIAGSRAQVDAFLAAVKPFDEGKPYDGTTIDAAYYAMIASLVARYEGAGRDVYFTYAPDPRIVKGYSAESVVAALKARRTAPAKSEAAAASWLTPVDESRFDFAHLTDGTVPLDRNVLLIRTWYGDLLGARAQLLARAGETTQAAPLAALSKRFLAGGASGQ
jgi:4-amino-4-deoxy-L-arabinose transferase-like glycosyltransferase